MKGIQCKCGKSEHQVLEKTTLVTYKLECLHCGLPLEKKHVVHEIGELL